MKRFLLATIVTVLAFGLHNSGRADDDSDAKIILDKAIQALGGAEKLNKAKAVSWKAKGKLNFGGNESEFSSTMTVGALDRSRGEFEVDFGGQQVKGVTVLDGSKGWRNFGGMVMELDKDSLTNERRTLYLQVVPITLLPLKTKDFTVKSLGEETAGDKAAVGVKATGPDGKEFKLYFDKTSGLPIRLEANVIGFDGQAFNQETTFDEYKEINGIKKATKIVNKRDGEKFLEVQLTEFKILDEVDPETFREPQ